MTTLYFKYATWNTSTSQWDWSLAHSFLCLDYDTKKVAEKITGDTLRSVKYSHQKAKRKIYTVKIGANVLYATAEMAWVETFWDAERWKLSTDNFATVDIEVVILEEELEKGRTAGHKGLPEVVLEMYQKYPDRYL